MWDRTLSWLANLAMACVLVFVSVQMPVFAQDDSSDSPEAPAEQAPDDGVEDESPDSEPTDSEPASEEQEALETGIPVELGGPQNLQIQLTGTAVMQTVGNLVIEPNNFNTGLLDIGQSSTTTVTLTHNGAEDAPEIQINASSLFGASSSEFYTDFSGYITLYPGDSVDIAVTFTPTFPGKKNAALRMDVGGASAPFVLIINGTARYPLTSDLEVESMTLEIGQSLVNKNKGKAIQFTNTALEADAPLINVSGVTFSGDTPEAFSSTFAPKTLGPGESMTFQVNMQSAQEGFKKAVMTVQHDGFNGDLDIAVEGEVVEPKAIPVNFSKGQLKNTGTVARPTSLQFGPDGHLYVAEMDGKIHEYQVTRNGKNNYTANKVNTINSVANMPNHNDDGKPYGGAQKRLVTGILVVGTPAKPVIYVQSSDWRQGGGPSGADKNLDTNSGILHRLTKNGNNWNKVDLVRGLPRSEENHHGNGMVMMGNKLLMAMGGTTNMGAPSNNFAHMTETALSAAILEFDLQALGNGTYDLPTLDDEDRPGVNDANDPFGGNNGKNQAKLVNGGPVQIYATGFRNAYDIVLSEGGKLYVTDNGPNAGWGGTPSNGCGNNIVDGGQTKIDQLHHVKAKGYYGGHPNPIRGNKNNKMNKSNPQTPVEGPANQKECTFQFPGQSLTTFQNSTNGLAEYTASNFGSAMQGDLLTASFNNTIFRLELNDAGTVVTSKSELFKNIGKTPLDVVAQGDNDIFPGTVWIVDNVLNNIYVYEPADYTP